MQKPSSFPFDTAYRWAIPAFLGAFAVVCYWNVLFTDRGTFPFDAANFFYPYLSYVHEELRNFHLPLWNPFVMSGYPIVGDMEAQIFYPINWLFVLLNPSSPLPFRLFEIQLVFHFFLAGLFMFYLARDLTGRIAPALLSGLIFMSSGAMVAHTQHFAIVNSMAWYPLIFLVARRALKSGNLFWTVSAGVIYGIQLLAGHWQHSVYMGFLLFLYFAYRACFGPIRSKLWPRWILQLLGIAAIGAALALVQILPSVELGLRSVRSQLTYSDISTGNSPAYLWTLILPNIFGGLHDVPMNRTYDLSLVYVFITIPGLLLAFLGLVETIRRRNFYYSGTLLLLVFFSFGHHGPLGKVLYAIPVLNMFRNPGMFFDPANFLLCLVTAFGVHALFGKDPWSRLKEYLPWILAALLVFAALSGLIWHLGGKIHGWYEMLTVLALFFLVAAAFLRNRLHRSVALGMILALVIFQIIYNNMNQVFNWSPNNPQTYATWEYALGSPKGLRFLRSDPKSDFRVGAIAEHILSTNGWNIWRIPAIYGWNPITLQDYQNYIQEFTQPAEYTTPRVFGDHELDSPMLDLLGTKYFLYAGPEFETENLSKQPGKFKHVFTDTEYWRIYENRDYLSRAWFFPRAYTVQGGVLATGLMKSRWFQARRTLLFDRNILTNEAAQLTQDLPSMQLLPDQVEGHSAGRAAADTACSQPQRYYRDWGGEGSWIRFDVAGTVVPGRYTILMRYTAGESERAPAVETIVENGGRRQTNGPVILPRTQNWNCASVRTTELGEFDLDPGTNKITLTLRRKHPVNLYSLWLVRLPDAPPVEPGQFSFRDFLYTSNHISLTAQLPQKGFILLNEVNYPGWEASVNGSPTPIYQTDGIFRALILEGGEHKIKLIFRPWNFRLGAAISLLTSLLFMAYAAICLRRKLKKQVDSHSSVTSR
ncbi:MAG: YfhO family protein [Acidobacteriia bacterium]|nr:YfhO family protein [Terriglobia bacterium]